MDYSSQNQDFSLDLGSFDLSDFVNSSSHELGDLFGSAPVQSGEDAANDAMGQNMTSGYASSSQTQTPAHGGAQPGHSAEHTAAGQLTVQQLLGMQQTIGQAASGSSDNPLGSTVTPAILKERLEQHMKIQQLQQLQTQILQQQINEMLRSSQGPTPTPRNNVAFQGLPTPAASTELGPTGQNDLVSMSPMLLQEMFMNSNPSASTSDHQQHQHMFERLHILQNPTMSAPAALAFNTSPPVADYELSPLWLPAGNPMPPSRGGQSQQHGASTSATKRPRRNSDVEDMGARKRPQVRMVPNMVPSPKKKTPSGTRTQRRAGTAGGDAMLPSPLDAHNQMLPPPPKEISSASSMSSITSVDTPQTTSVSPDIAPATPAGIMGLAPMRSGLVPPPAHASEERRTTRRRDSKAKTPATPAAPKKMTGTPKAILPTGGTPILPPSASGSGAGAQPPLHVRKSSHKVAEQKRRDSLKISFDDLRLLLPPIPVNVDDAERDEPLLPGAMPPRGPPRGESDGPNRAVSKLALLRCGNEYIRELKWKMDVRDEEIARLRREVARMRAGFEALGIQDTPGEDIDLERDLDAGYEEVRRARKAANAAARRAAGDFDDDDDFE